MKKRLLNKIELRKYIINSKGNTSSLKIIHFFENVKRVMYEF